MPGIKNFNHRCLVSSQEGISTSMEEGDGVSVQQEDMNVGMFGICKRQEDRVLDAQVPCKHKGDHGGRTKWIECLKQCK